MTGETQMEKDAEFALKRIKDIGKISGKKKEVVMTNTEKAGFLLKCLKCGSTIIAIIPSKDEEGEAIMLLCLKCDNTVMMGTAIPKQGKKNG